MRFSDWLNTQADSEATITLCPECLEKDPKLEYPQGTDYELTYPDGKCPTCGWKPKQDFNQQDYLNAAPRFDHYPVNRKRVASGD